MQNEDENSMMGTHVFLAKKTGGQKFKVTLCFIGNLRTVSRNGRGKKERSGKAHARSSGKQGAGTLPQPPKLAVS